MTTSIAEQLSLVQTRIENVQAMLGQAKQLELRHEEEWEQTVAYLQAELDGWRAVLATLQRLNVH